MKKIASLTTWLLLFLFSLMFAPTATLLAQTETGSDIVCEHDVIVQPNDSLWAIARKFYNNPRNYTKIIEATNLKAQGDNSYPTISNKIIIPGWKLCVPSQITVAPAAISTPAPAPAPASAPAAIPPVGVIKIGAAQALSGSSDIYGKSIRDGIKLAVTQVNESDYLGEATLEVVWEDTQGSPLEAIRAFDKLINQHQVAAIIGPTRPDSALVAGWLAQQQGVPVISSSNTPQGVGEIGSYMFSSALPDSAMIQRTIQEAKNQFGLERVAVIYDESDLLSKSGYDILTQALAEEDLTVVVSQTVKTGDTDFSQQLSQIQDQSPDAIVVNAQVTEAAEILKQARQLGIPESVRFIGTAFGTLAGEAANGAMSGVAWHADHAISKNQQFIADFEKEFSRDPDQFAAQTYTAVWALATAIRDANSTDRAAIRDGLDAMGVIESPLGPFTFDNNGNPLHPLLVQVVEKDNFTFTPQNPNKIIKIGAGHALSGELGSQSLVGRQGLTLAIKEINESGFLGEFALELIWEDSGGTPQQATQAFHKLINDHQVVAIFGPTLSNSAFASDILAQTAGVPVIANSNVAPGITEIGDYIFQLSMPETDIMAEAIKTSKEQLGLRKVAVIYDNVNLDTKRSFEEFASLFFQLEKEPIIETVKTDDTDFSEQLTKIKELKPDAVIVVALPQQGIQILRQARELGIPPDVRFIGGSGLNTAKVINELGDAADGLISGAPWNIESKEKESEKFVEAYREEYGPNSDPDSFAAQAYTAGWVLAHAIRNAKNEGKDPTDPTVIRNALDNLGVIDSPMGDFRFENREPHHDLVVQAAQNGKWVPIEDIDRLLPTDLPSSIKVGVAHDLSGPAAAYGNSIRQGIELAVEQINEDKKLGKTKDGEAVALEVILQDTAGDGDQARGVFEKLINEDEVVAILGPTLSKSAFAADSLAQEAGVPVIASSNTATGITDIGEYIFRTSLPERIVIPNTIKEVKALLAVQNVAVIYDEEDDFTKSGYEIFKQVLEEEGIEIVSTETFSANETDFSAQLTKIKESNPEAIVVSALVKEAAEILKQARQLGIPESVRFIGGNGFNTPELFELAGEAANEAISGSAWNIQTRHPASEKFVQAYQAKYNSEPDQFAAQAYTAVLVLAKAIRHANSVERAAIRDALVTVDQSNKMDSPLGLFYFDEKRDPVHPAVVQSLNNGQFIPLR